MNETGNIDSRTYSWASFTLRAGMYSSFTAMALGLAWWLLAGSPGGNALAVQGLPVGDVFPRLLAGDPLALLSLGVLLLLVTPGVSLLVGIAAYASMGNWRFAAIGSLVAVILILGFALSMKWIKLF